MNWPIIDGSTFGRKEELFKFGEFNTKFISCNPNRYTYHVIKGANLPVVVTYQNCECNEYLAYRYRHQNTGSMRVNNVCFEWGDVDSEPYVHIKSVLNDMHSHMVDYIPRVMKYTKFVNKHSGRIRARYVTAKRKLKMYGIQPRNFVNKSFIKDDKYHINYEKGVFHDPSMPRAIQYQSPEATLFKAQYIVPIEEYFYKMLDVHGLRVFTKGLNQYDVGKLFFESDSKFACASYIENDFSSFDATVCVDLLKIFHSYVLAYVPKEYRRIMAWAFRFDLRPRGYTSSGRPFKTIGTITSGSIDTSFKGNFINYLVTVSILKFCGINETHFKFICNGDDSVLFVDKTVLRRVDFTLFLRFGLNAKTIVKDCINQVEFCRSKPLRFGNSCVMVRDPVRCITRLGWMVRNIGKRANLDYVKTVVMGEMALNYQVPVIYPMLRKIFHNIKGKIRLGLMTSYIQEVYQNQFWRLDMPYVGDPSWDLLIYDMFPGFHGGGFSLLGPDHELDYIRYEKLLCSYGLLPVE